MLKRALTSIIGIPLAIVIITWGSPVIDIAGMIIGLIGINEFYRVIKKNYCPITWIGYLGVVVYIGCFEWAYNNFVWYCVFMILLGLITMVFRYPKYSIVDVALTFIAPLYVGVLLGFVLLLRNMPKGEFFVWLIFIGSWGSDTCAYFAGRFLGKHKLAPVLSPKKTIEGAIGGAIGAGALGIIYTVVYSQFDQQIAGVNVLVIGAILIIVALLSQIGDLAASAIKRFFDEKDYGTLFPGHGGVLDRFDSVLFVAPILYLILNLM